MASEVILGIDKWLSVVGQRRVLLKNNLRKGYDSHRNIKGTCAKIVLSSSGKRHITPRLEDNETHRGWIGSVGMSEQAEAGWASPTAEEGSQPNVTDCVSRL